jgi:hypothetical protein
VTLIAVTHVDDSHVIFGDLLISQEIFGPVDRHLTLPTQDLTYTRESDAGPVITGLAQKLCVLNQNFAIAWSGTRIYAKSIIQEIVGAFGPNYDITWPDLDKFLRSIDPADSKHVSLVGMLWHGETITHFGWRAKQFTFNRFKQVRAAGSGVDHLREVMKLYDSFSMPDASSACCLFHAALAKVFSVCSWLIGDEFQTRTNLHLFYGGGFEIVCAKDGRFQKIGDITFLFWFAEVASTEMQLWPCRIAIKVCYSNDILIIRRVNFAEEDPEVLKLPHYKKQATFVIAPFHRNVDKSEADEIVAKGPPGLNSDITCHYVLLNLPRGVQRVYTSMEFGGGDRVKFVKEDDQDFLVTPRRFGEAIFESVRENFKNDLT